MWLLVKRWHNSRWTTLTTTAITAHVHSSFAESIPHFDWLLWCVNNSGWLTWYECFLFTSLWAASYISEGMFVIGRAQTTESHTPSSLYIHDVTSLCVLMMTGLDQRLWRHYRVSQPSSYRYPSCPAASWRFDQHPANLILACWRACRGEDACWHVDHAPLLILDVVMWL